MKLSGVGPVGLAVVCTVFGSIFAMPAVAIPSPELVIGSAASLSQIFAFGSAVLGGGAIVAGRRSGFQNIQGQKARKKLVFGGIGVVVIAVALAGLNIYQFQTAKQIRLSRLQATLNRPAVIVDASLQETSFDAQASDPLGISTIDAAKVLDAGDTLFIDVRENAENLMGTIPGAQHIRFPDVDLNDPKFKGRQVVLLCHNGNRSSETCRKLAALGIDCRFIVGGIEKWIVEGREFSDQTVRTLSDLRAIPDYKNKDTLLDTDDVATLFADQDVQVIDVRYPGDFADNHLPGAINIAMRATGSGELARRIATLSDKPIITACYDRRGCFISQVLGYELAQAGLDYRGRYTLPWEYFVPKPTKPHVALWLAEQNQSNWQKTITALSLVLGWIGARTHFLFAIVALALTTRLLILPVALKAERDQIVSAQAAPELLVLKIKYKDDPSGKPEALKAHYEKHGLTPGRNLLALVFLPVTMLGLSAVQLAGVGQAGFGWLGDMGSPDPLYILPALATVLGCLYLQLSVAKTRRGVVLSWLIGLPVLGVLIAQLNAGGATYLIVAMGLLFVQRAYVTGAMAGAFRVIGLRVRKAIVANVHGGIIPLRYSELLGQAGNKALRLSQMSRGGFPVPGGVVLNAGYLAHFNGATKVGQEKMADRILRHFGDDLLAVRSSSTAEDGDDLSFAGVFESRLNIGPADLVDAISQVSASFGAAHSRAYADGGQGNILIQRMVQPEFAGVLFTLDPRQPGIAIAEFVKGNAEDLVSGRVVPTTCRFGRASGKLLGESTPMDFAPLLEMAQRIETFFGAPQDIEWTYRAGKFEIVQSRNITALDAPLTDPVVKEWSRLFAHATDGDTSQAILRQDEMSEVLPMPTPLSLSYMQLIWSHSGSVALACQRLGIRYRAGGESHLTTVFGRLFAICRQKEKTAVHISRQTRKFFDKTPGQIANSYRADFLPRFDQRMAELNATDFMAIEVGDLQKTVSALFDEFISDIHAEVETINIAAGYHMQRAVDACRRDGVDAAGVIRADGGVTPAALLRYVDKADTRQRREKLLTYFGHRAPHDYELSAPRYSEDDGLLDGLLGAADVAVSQNNAAKDVKGVCEQTRTVVETAQDYQALKDAAKHQALRHLAQIRRALEALDTKLGFDGLVHYLTLGELPGVLQSGPQLRLLAQGRRELREQMLGQKALAATLTIAQLEAAAVGLSGGSVAGALSGQRVSGDRVSSGRVYLTSREQSESGAPLSGFQPGDILACSFVHPNWLPYVLTSGGVIAEVGGWLSHIAIVAREHNVTLVVGVSGWEALSHGVSVTVDIKGNVTMPDQVPEQDKANERRVAMGR